MSLDGNANVTLGAQGHLLEGEFARAAGDGGRGSEGEIATQLSDELAAVRDRILEAFAPAERRTDEDEVSSGTDWQVLGFRGELTIVVPADRITDVLAFCRDDEEVRCELLADLSGVHWPGGEVEAHPEETTGWPTYAETREGRIELDYLLRSLTHGHRFRLRVNLLDEQPRLASATRVYRAANFMEREVYDFFGVVFEGHPNLTRILMPEDWKGHPHRKDYPLGGVEVQYKGATVPPPDERRY